MAKEKKMQEINEKEERLKQQQLRRQAARAKEDATAEIDDDEASTLLNAFVG